MKRETLQSILGFLMKILTKTEYQGLEHLPSTGRVIVATNHLSRVDIPVLAMTPNRPDFTALVADKYQSRPLFRFIIATMGGIWIDRSKADFAALRLAQEELKKEKALGIAPEGTRSIAGTLLEGKAGTVLLAIKSDTMIVPVGIHGTETSIRTILSGRRAQIIARFGPGFCVPSLPRENRDEFLARMTEEVMCRIAVLLPERYHGFYTGHPRIQELREEGLC